MFFMRYIIINLFIAILTCFNIELFHSTIHFYFILLYNRQITRCKFLLFLKMIFYFIAKYFLYKRKYRDHWLIRTKL